MPRHVATVLRLARIPSALASVASAFRELREARHEADYDTSRRFTRQETMHLVLLAEDAAERWRTLRHTGTGKAYLHALYSWRKWRR